MTDEWASELAAWNVANERARQEFDAIPNICGQKKPVNITRVPLSFVEIAYARAYRACRNGLRPANAGTMGQTEKWPESASNTPGPGPTPDIHSAEQDH